MLSLKHILKVGRLLEQSGEPRPGFLHDEVDNFEGQGTSVQPGALTSTTKVACGREQGQMKSLTVSLDYEIDRKTGDVRIVQR